MPTVAEVTEPLRPLLKAVPPRGVGICQVCHRSTNGTFETCYSCGQTTTQVSHPHMRVTPITLYETGGQIHHNLRYYKDSPDPDARRLLTLNVVALLARFLQRHGACAAPAGWDCIVGVPSTRDPSTTHPLVEALRRIRPLGSDVQELLTAGDVPLSHGHASDRGYVAVEAPPQRALLVDDTFTTGARLQSAASVLTRAGHNVTGAVVIGRVYDVNFGDRGPLLWDLVHTQGFDFDVCCWDSSPWSALD